MQLAIERTGSIAVVVFDGRLDSNTVSAVERDLAALIDGGGTRLVFDLAALAYISSAGLRVMLVMAKRLKQAGGRLALCCLGPQVGEVFEISGFQSIMTIVPTREEALAAV